MDKLKAIQELYMRKWNDPLCYNPIGCSVLVLTPSGEVLKAYRDCPSKSKNEHGDYLRVSNGEIIKDILGWSYL